MQIDFLDRLFSFVHSRFDDQFLIFNFLFCSNSTKKLLLAIKETLIFAYGHLLVVLLLRDCIFPELANSSSLGIDA